MGRISKEILFNAPLEKVWRIWIDVQNTPKWVDGVQETEITRQTEGKGLAWKEKCEFGKKVIQMDHQFSEWEALKRTVITTGLPMGGSMERVAEFKAGTMNDSSAPQTIANVSMEWDLGIVGAFFDEAKLQHMMEKSFDQTASNWKRLAEGA